MDDPVSPCKKAPCDLPSKTSSKSFWHSEPSPLLTAHRSTRELPTTADVVVIGSGVTGASIAHHLLTSADETANGQRRPLDVVMLEAREACWGATGRNGGHVQPLLLEHPHDPAIGRFEISNFHAIQKHVHDNAIDCEFVPQPGVRALYSQSFLNLAELAFATVQSNAPDLASLMKLVTDPNELAQLRIPTATAAIVTSTAARLWPYKLVTRVLEDLITASNIHGRFNLQTLTPVEAISPADGERWTVSTKRGTITASKVVLATNAYTSHLLPDFSDLIVPCRGTMSALSPLPSVAGAHRLQANFGFASEGVDDYLIQRPNERGGQLMFGGGRQTGPSLNETDDSVVDPATAHYLRTRLVSEMSLPEGRHSKDVAFEADYVWSGIMGFSRDDLPWVGPVPGRANLYMAGGYTGHGMPNAWLCGKAVAVMVGGEGTEEDNVAAAIEATALPTAYLISPERFATARSVETVEARDWADMTRGIQRARAGSSSGYA